MTELSDYIRCVSGPLEAALRSQVSTLTRERDEARAELVARANSMEAMRDKLVIINDDIEDEGDRVYFGSSNDADLFREAVQDFDDWARYDILRDTRKHDVFAASRAAHARAETAEALLKEAGEVLRPFAKAGTLFRDDNSAFGPALIYAPAAGPAFYLNSGHLTAAVNLITKIGNLS